MERDRFVRPALWNHGKNLGIAAQSLGLTREQVIVAEQPLETAVSRQIARMPFLWLAVGDIAGPQSDRGRIERGAIAHLSNYGKPVIDAASPTWLGNHCDRECVRRSGLWNNDHVREGYDTQFLDLMEQYVEGC